jgi:hypothetical protein
LVRCGLEIDLRFELIFEKMKKAITLWAVAILFTLFFALIFGFTRSNADVQNPKPNINNPL